MAEPDVLEASKKTSVRLRAQTELDRYKSVCGPLKDDRLLGHGPFPSKAVGPILRTKDFDWLLIFDNLIRRMLDLNILRLA